ncbi:MAG: lysophospholipid acyltransferase family protein [Bdellovibrionales bacterium]|nr:lysophospholipid acyltransferase family protein [Bdellovibrionales bacterium]
MKRLADILALIAVVPVIELLRLLPYRAGLWLSLQVVRVVLSFFRRSKSVARRNLQIAFPEKTAEEHERIIEASYVTLARNLLSFARIPRLSPDYARATTDYTETLALIERLRRESGNAGVIIATAHFGSFEGVVQRGALVHEPAAILARGFGLPLLDAWWNRRRTRFGNNVFFRKGGYKDIVLHLKQGRIVAVLFDQNIKAKHATFVPFFGLQTAATRALGLAVQRTGARVVFAVGIETGDDHMKIVSEEVPLPEIDDRDELTRELMTRLHAVLERTIREYPEQWFWIHRRWKTRPAGEPETVYDSR